MIALLIAANSPSIAVGLVVGFGLGYIVAAEVYFDRGYQRGRRIRDTSTPAPRAEPQAPRALPVNRQDRHEHRLIHLVPLAPTGASKGRK